VVPDTNILSSSSSLDSLLLELLGSSLDEVDTKGFFPFAGDLGNAPGVAVCSLAISLSDSFSVCEASSLASCLLASSILKVEAFFACGLAFLDIDPLGGFASSFLSSVLPDLVFSSSPMLGNLCYRAFS